jgi:hypothetical protein
VALWQRELTGGLQTFHGGRLECVARLCSKSVRHLDQRDLQALDALGPLVAPSLRSGRHSPGPLGHLKPVDPSVSGPTVAAAFHQMFG